MAEGKTYEKTTEAADPKEIHSEPKAPMKPSDECRRYGAMNIWETFEGPSLGWGAGGGGGLWAETMATLDRKPSGLT